MIGDMTNEELQTIRERCEKATAGPWHVTEYIGPERIVSLSVAFGPPDNPAECCDLFEDPSPGTCEFITHAVDDVPKLLAEIDRLRIANHKLLVELSETGDTGHLAKEAANFLCGAASKQSSAG